MLGRHPVGRYCRRVFLAHTTYNLHDTSNNPGHVVLKPVVCRSGRRYSPPPERVPRKSRMHAPIQRNNCGAFNLRFIRWIAPTPAGTGAYLAARSRTA